MQNGKKMLLCMLCLGIAIGFKVYAQTVPISDELIMEKDNTDLIAKEVVAYENEQKQITGKYQHIPKPETMASSTYIYWVDEYQYSDGSVNYKLNVIEPAGLFSSYDKIIVENTALNNLNLIQ